MEQEEKLSLDFGNGEIYEVWLEVATYPADKNIKVCVFTEKEIIMSTRSSNVFVPFRLRIISKASLLMRYNDSPIFS